MLGRKDNQLAVWRPDWVIRIQLKRGYLLQVLTTPIDNKNSIEVIRVTPVGFKREPPPVRGPGGSPALVWFQELQLTRLADKPN